MRTILTFLACLALAPMATGCSRAGEYCDLKCDCEGCSDVEYDECKIDRNAQEDRASAYDCTDEFLLANDCTVDHNNCSTIPVINKDVFSAESSCNDEIADAADCIKRHSAIY